MGYLDLQNITVKYGKLFALKKVTLSIEKNDIFGLIGANGSGKTTLLKVIVGLLKPRKGQLFLENTEIKPKQKSIRRILGYCPQENSFFDKLTVKENLKLFASLYNVKGNLNKLSTDMAKSLNLHPKLNEIASKLSGGMKRRLNIGCSIMHSPQILLLDEPTIELDPFSRRIVWELIKKINSQGTTIIVATNSMEEANFLCNFAAFLHQGKVNFTGNPAKIVKIINDMVWSE